MSIRTFRVGPDQVTTLLNGTKIATVSRQAQIDGLSDAMVCCDRLGGTISVLYGRARTGLPGEMATTELLVTWADRTDARPQQEEPVAFEPHGDLRIVELPEGPADEIIDGEPAVDEQSAEDAAVLGS